MTHGGRKRASIHTLGCRLNQAETALIADRLAEAGYTLVPFGDEADLGIVHTCTVTREADAKSRKLIRRFVKRNPAAFTAVVGCYAQMGAGEIAALEGVDLIAGNQEKFNVAEYAKAGKCEDPVILRDRVMRDEFTIDFADVGPRLTCRALLKIQDGCDFMCSFCRIPFARGRSRSRDIANLGAEAERLVARGARELVLTGVNVGTYASGGRTVVDVVDRLDAIEGLARIRIGSIEPTTIPPGLLERMADAAHALVPHLHIPLQSGSNLILAAMRRQYRREDFAAFVEEAAALVPDLGVGTDVMVGFPGETEADFADTYALLDSCPLFYAHVFKYSKRPGTASARLAEPVDPKTASARSAALHQLSAAKTRAFLKRHRGREPEVLFEEEEKGYWGGYTANYVRVAAPSESPLANTLCRVRIERGHGDIAYGSVV